jgi:hypothetical protein
MKLTRIATLISVLVIAACSAGSGPAAPSTSTSALTTDALVAAQLSALGVQCTPELPRPAVAACTGKAAGDACTVTRLGQTVNAKCGSDDGVLMCGADEDEEGLPPVLTDACTGKIAGDACNVSGDERCFAGVCTALGSGSVACLPPPPPTPAPVAACADKVAGDACTVTHDDHSYSGACTAVPGGLVACLPPPPPLPPALTDPCTGMAAGDACTVTGHEHTFTGVCTAVPSGLVACLPPPPPPPPAPPQAVVDACAAHASGDACSFTWDNGKTVNGACAEATDGTLVCAPACHR